MPEARLATHIWVSALRRRCEAGGASLFVTRKGDRDAGVVFVKVALLNGKAWFYAPSRTVAGQAAWTVWGPMAEPDADQRLGRELEFDPDAWAIEIEDREGRHFLEEPVEDP